MTNSPGEWTIASLRDGAVRALESLGTGIIVHPENGQLRAMLESGELTAQRYSSQLLRIVYRLLFLFAAEDRKLLRAPDTDHTSIDRYEFVSVRRLRDLATRDHVNESDDLWITLNQVFKGLASGCPDLGLPGKGPFLLMTESRPTLIGPSEVGETTPVALSNGALLKAVRALAFIEKPGTLVPRDFRSVCPEDFGSVYEGLLEFVPHIEPGTRTLSYRSACENERKTSGSYYTPVSLIEYVLDSALDPVVDCRLAEASSDAEANGHPVRESQEAALLSITVCDPSVGCGHFLLAAARRLARRLASIRADGEPTEDQRRHSLRDVIGQCLFGVDINPMASELCKASLWFEASDPECPLSVLDDHVKVGNALLGATPALMKDGIPDETFKSLAGDDNALRARFKKRNRLERRASRSRFAGETDDAASEISAPEHARVAANAWCAAFVWPMNDAGDPSTEPRGEVERDAITESVFRALEDDHGSIDPWLTSEIKRLTREYQFFHWHLEFPKIFSDQAQGFDVVLGNPPFLNQLESATVAQRGPAAMLQVITGGAVRGYTDLSATFLLRSIQLCRPGGRVALVQPQSLLAAKDAGSVRSAVLEDASLASLWISNEHVFDDANVFTCAPTLHRGGRRSRRVERSSTRAFTRLPPLEVDSDLLRSEETWAHVAAAALGIPEFEFESNGTIGDVATATADFRDQYYGLDGFLVEGADVSEDDADTLYPPLATTGLIDLAACNWGRRPTRVLKRTWSAPRIDLERMQREGTLAQWIASRRVPKVILATQTKILEVYVDESGRYVPSLPLITVVPIRDDLWRVAAALASPVCAALAMQRYSGAALSAQAIKLSATQALRLPIPANTSRWTKATEFLRAAQGSDAGRRSMALREFGKASIAAFAVPDGQAAPLMDWWARRLNESKIY
ncbi:MAG: hypothetical protein AAGI53_02100 [Planctomycetota bacterium]